MNHSVSYLLIGTLLFSAPAISTDDASTSPIQFDSSITIRLLNGQVIVLADKCKFTPETGKLCELRYEYVRKYGQEMPTAYMFSVQDLETVRGRSLILNKTTGHRLYIYGATVLSPDKKRLVATQNSIDSGGHALNIIQIVSLEEKESKLEWTHSPDNWGPFQPKWLDANSIRIMQDRLREPLRRVVLRNIGSTWKFFEK